VEAFDSTDPHYGNGGDIYVNTSSTLGNLKDQIARSLFVIGSSGNEVEVGWLAAPGRGPTIYAEWINRGVDSHPQLYNSVGYDSTRTFKVQNTGHVEIFRFYFDGEGSPFNYSPTMNFQQGTVVTNSEHYNSCDSLWTHMTSLSYFRSSGVWQLGYGALTYYYCKSVNDYLLDIISDTELYVDQNNGICGG
jgi:hypothetical protein